jgi:hypothetical protein
MTNKSFSPLPAYHVSVVRLACSACGAEANASCSCGKPYVPKQQRAAEAVAAHPEKSNRAIAEEIDVSEPTVRRARDAAASHDAPDTVVGRDGKSYPAQHAPPTSDVPDTPVVREGEADRKLALDLIGLGYRALAQRLQADPIAMQRLNRVSDQMRSQWDFEWF